MDQLGNSAQLEKVISHVTKVIESQVDTNRSRIDADISNLGDEDELKALRQKRLQAMKKAQEEKEGWLANGHGKYEEIPDEGTFFAECKKAKNLVVHFYREATFRCKIVDKHLSILAAKHLEAKFMKIDAEKSPFLTQRLKIRVLPTICLLRDGKVVDYIVGFTDLGNTDDFATVVLEWRIATQQLIEYDGDLMTRPLNGVAAPSKTKEMLAQSLRDKKKNIRGPSDGYSSDENDW